MLYILIEHNDMCTSVNVRSSKTSVTNTKKKKEKHRKKKISSIYLKSSWYELNCLSTCIHKEIMTYTMIYSSKLNTIDELESIHNISLGMYMMIPDFWAYIHIGPSYLYTYLLTYLPTFLPMEYHLWGPTCLYGGLLISRTARHVSQERCYYKHEEE